MVANFSVTINLKEDEPRNVTLKVIKRALHLSAIELKGNLQRNSPVDDGKMQGSWFVTTMNPFEPQVFSSAVYTPFVNYGTGIYGPRGRRIYPKTKKALKFMYKGNEVVVKSIKGQKPRKFVEKSITQTERRSDEFVIRSILEFQGELS